jgi:hypothetical protein
MSNTAVKVARDLDVDLAICEAATLGPWIATELDNGVLVVRDHENVELVDAQFSEDSVFIAEAREGWPYAIRRVQEAERENDRLLNELNMLQQQLDQHHQSKNFD